MAQTVAGSRFFEDYQVGEQFTSLGRTVTEADVVNFAGVSGDFNPIHMDAESAKASVFGERIAHGLLGLSIASGLIHDTGLLVGTVVAFTGLDWKFKGAIKFGDTIKGTLKVAGKKKLKGMGLVQFDAQILNQRGEVVQQGRWSLMIKTKEG